MTMSVRSTVSVETEYLFFGLVLLQELLIGLRISLLTALSGPPVPYGRLRHLNVDHNEIIAEVLPGSTDVCRRSDAGDSDDSPILLLYGLDQLVHEVVFATFCEVSLGKIMQDIWCRPEKPFAAVSLTISPIESLGIPQRSSRYSASSSLPDPFSPTTRMTFIVLACLGD